MDGEKFLEVAHELLKKHKEEYNRSAINRGYYAAYNKGVVFFEKKIGIKIPKGPPGHEAIKNNFKNSGVQLGYKIYNSLITLYSDRIKADYRMDNDKFENDATTLAIYTIAKNIIKHIDEIIDKCDLGKIKQAIKS